jgi:gamma-carbonic anhydrase
MSAMQEWAARFPGATILPFEGKHPRIHESAFIAPGARIIGDVEVGAEASIWYNCVLRGDIHRIVVGPRSNVQDGTVIHVEGPRPDDSSPTDGCPTIIGADCVIGHMAVVHGAVLDDGAFVGMGAVAMDYSRVSSGAMLGAGALLSPGKVIPRGEIWVGRPAKFLRAQDEAQIAKIRFQTQRYCLLAQRHLAAIREAGLGQTPA